MRRHFWIAIPLLLLGCSSRPTLAGGTWSAEAMGGKSRFVFANDGSVKLDVGLPIIGTIPATGTYSETETALTITLQRVDLPNNAIGANAKKLLDELVGRPVAFKLTWTSEDEVEMASMVPAGPFGQNMTLKREKG